MLNFKNMNPRLLITGVLVGVLCRLSTSEAQTGAISNLKEGCGSKREAYVTLLYGDGENLLSVRVLGLSLKLSCTKRELVVICTEEASLESRRILEKDGWMIKQAENIGCPYSNCPKHFSKIFLKFLIWTLTEYRRVVFLDSDALVYANIDEIFHCGKFCASYQTSDLFDTGVLVIKPDFLVYRNLTSKIGIYSSYDTADEGFLNYYYQHLIYAPMFNSSNPHYQEEPMRLPAIYNGDIVQYYAYTFRFFPPDPYKVLHHTLGPIKPWRWWAYPIFDRNWHWVELRDNLHPTNDSPIGLFFAAMVNYTFLMLQVLFTYCNVPKSTQIAIVNDDGILFRIIVTLMFPSSCTFGFLVVPSSMHPHYAIPIFCFWTVFFLRLICYGVYFAKSTSQPHYEFPMSKFNTIVLIGALLFVTLVLPLYISSFFIRVCVFILLSLLTFVCSHLIVCSSAVKL
jgi:glycogenin glucosyltransferase